jgi:hypothetical protein
VELEEKDQFEEDLRQSIVAKIDEYYFKNNLKKDKFYAELLLIISGV